MIESITFNAKNAFGIGSMTNTFSFVNKKDSKSGAHCIALYAPNGTGKTSLLKSIEAWAGGGSPKDEFLGKDGSFSIATVPPDALKRENVRCFKTRTQLEGLQFFSGNVLASPELSARYEGEIRSHNERRAALLGELRKTIISGKSGSGLDELEAMVLSAAGKESLPDALESLAEEARAYIAPDYVVNDKLDKLLNSSNSKALDKPEVSDHLASLTKARNEILANSGILDKDFDYVSASELGKQLGKLSFFKPGHSVVLHNRLTGEDITISSVDDYRKAIEDELVRVEDDERVREEYKQADGALGRTSASQAFREKVCSDPRLAADLSAPGVARRNFLLYAIQQRSASVTSYIAEERRYEKLMRELSGQAAAERTEWDDAVQLFLDRFRVPFTPRVKNRSGAVTGTQVPVIEFDYGDTRVPNDTLFRNLSEGECKALYMLYIIFEVERARRGDGDKLLVFDDVVDSFDYANKYAFIEYLGEFASDPTAHVLVLTHNFDFFRTVTSRLKGNFKRTNCRLMEIADGRELFLRDVDYTEKNVMRQWRDDVKNPNAITRMAAIPMVRELAAIQGASEKVIGSLSSVIHGRESAEKVRFCDLAKYFNDYWGSGCLEGDERPVIQTILEACDSMEAAGGNGNRMALPEKVVLSMGVRFLVERCISTELGQEQIEVEEGPLGALARELKQKLPDAYKGHSELIQQAVLMTPENIHLNSFMYEPLIDMGIHRLFALYRECKAWKAELEGEA